MTDKIKIRWICTQCDVKVKDWDKHCETKQHNKMYEIFHKNFLPIAKIVFDSRFVSKSPELFGLIPRVKWKQKDWNVKK